MSMTDNEAGGPSLTNVRERVSDVADGFDSKQKMTMLGGAAFVVVAVLAWSFFGNTTEFAPLVTDLGAEDANAITATLTERGIPYELESGGSTIMVPREDVYQTRLDIAEVELPGSGKVGYGILDSQGMAASEFTQQVGYQRALEGEFASTIEAINGVQVATVHLALPKNDTFALSDQEATASVLVKTDEGQTLSSNQTQAIVNLVASGVEDMSPDDVTVADAEGNVLASPGTGVTGAAGGGNDALEGYETTVANAIESLLVAVVGPGKVSSTVSADIDFDQTSTVSETYSPPAVDTGGDPLAISESTRNETYTGDAEAPEGVLGVQGDETGATDTTGSGYELDERQVNNALNKVVETTQESPGKINRLSVAVIVDEGAVPADQLAEIEALVAQAAGIQADRGDTLTVSRLPFDTSLAEAQAAALEARPDATPAGMNPMMIGGGVMLLLLLVGGAVFALKKKKQGAEDDEVLSLPVAGDVRDGVLEPELVSRGTINLDDRASGERQEVLGELIDNQPDEVAQLLRGWLGDRRESVR